MVRVLGLALYGPLAASHRIRIAQYAPGLAGYGVELEIQSLLNDAYLKKRFSGETIPIFSLLASGYERIGYLYKQNRYDLLILHCELFPLLPGFMERIALTAPYIYDFDDAMYLKYEAPHFRFFRGLLHDKFGQIIGGAAAVTAGSGALAAYARQFNNNTLLLPSCVDTSSYKLREWTRDDVFTVGWIGSPSTAPYLSALAGPLARLAERGPVRFVVIGGKAPHIAGVDVLELPWSEETEKTQLGTFDAGVMPLPDNEWTRGKCAFKLIQYMASGLPVIGSRVGANVDVVTEDCGYLVDDDDGWFEALKRLSERPDLRREMGLAGRRRVEETYSLNSNLPILAEAILEVAARGKQGSGA